MSNAYKDAKLSLKVMINKEKNKVLYAVADSHFVDILLSFLTLSLGRIIKVLDNHYGKKAPTIGSLSNLYCSLANLDSTHFWTKGAKQNLLNPRSSFEEEHKCLKLDISDHPPTEYFHCTNYKKGIHYGFHSVSVYYDQLSYCYICQSYGVMTKTILGKRSAPLPSYGVFTKPKASFIISDNLHIFPNEKRLLAISSIHCTTDMEEAEEIKVDFGFNEIMKLLKASLTSPTPLSDVILKKTAQMKPATAPKISLHEIVNEGNPNFGNLSLEVMVQKSTGKLLFAKGEENFIEFLFSFFNIPLGKVEHLLGGETCFKAINNLYRSTAELIDDMYFDTSDMKMRLMKPNVIHGCISKHHILPLTEEPLPEQYNEISYFSPSRKFPKGQGSYLKGPQFYEVSDDLTVKPCYFDSGFFRVDKQKIPLSDVEILDLQIGLKEALSILKASLSSASAITDALLSHNSNK